MRRKIVIICDQASKSGGHARVAIESAAELARSGEEVVYFASNGPVDEELLSAGVDVVLTGQSAALEQDNQLYGAIQGIWNTRAQKMIAQLVSDARSSSIVFHVHGWTKSLSPSVLSEIVSSRHPVICTLHEFFTVCPNGALFNFQTKKSCELTPMSRECMATNCDSRSYKFKLWRLARQFVMERRARFPDKVTSFIYTTEFSKRIISRFLPPDADYRYLANPVFVKQRPQVSAWNNKSFIYVGRLDVEKGVSPAAEIMYRLGIPFEIAGTGKCAEEIKAANPNAVLHNWLNSEQLTALFERARALVFPSLWYETYGLAVSEALARGVPVIGSRESAAAERIIDDKNGKLFSWKNAGELENALLTAADSSVVRRWSRFGYDDYWKAPRTIDRHVEGLRSIYDDVLQQASNGPRQANSAL